MEQNPLKYFVYLRKSTDDTKHQVLSLPAQRSEIAALIKREGLDAFEPFEESMSSKQPGRPVFNDMLNRIERGEANGILCWDIDRLYRNPVDEGRTRWLLQRGVIRSIRTPGREYRPQDAGLLMAVESGRAVEHILSMARNLKRTYEEKLRRGQWPGRKNVGYLFDHTIKNIVPHPIESKVIRNLFEEFSTGRIGFEAGARLLMEHGIITREKKPLSKSEMSRLLTNPIYMGVIRWKGELYEGKFAPIISSELFRTVQKVIKVKSKPRKHRNGHNFPFCGIFRCTCGAMITAQWAKGHGGIYRYYRCSRKSGNPCHEKYLREEDLVNQCISQLRPFTLRPEEATEILALIDAEAKAQEGGIVEQLKTQDEKLRTVDENLKRLTRLLIQNVIDEENYLASKEELVLEKTGLKDERKRLQKTYEHSWIEPSRSFIKTLETLGKSDFSQNFAEISRSVQKIGTNHLISRKNVLFSISEKYAKVPSLLASARVVPLNTSVGSETDLSQSSKWCARQDLNLHALRHYHLKVARLPIPPRAQPGMNETTSLKLRKLFSLFLQRLPFPSCLLR